MERIPPNLRERIRAKVKQLAADPASLANNLTALKGEDALRLRIGDWRVVLELTPDQVVVYRVTPRGAAYR